MNSPEVRLNEEIEELFNDNTEEDKKYIHLTQIEPEEETVNVTHINEKELDVNETSQRNFNT